MRSIELFTGAGGLALGSHRAGFHHLAVVERDRDSCDTLRLNRERGTIDWPIHQDDLARFSYADLPQGIDLLAGGPPCQPFSLGGKHRGHEDERNMFPEAVRAVRELRPRAFLIENVKGLLREAFRPYYEYLVERLRLPLVEHLPGEPWEAHRERLVAAEARRWLRRERYQVAYRLFNAADFGVPQQRHRVFIAGFRADLGASWRFPEPTHSADALLHAQWVTGSYWAEHGLPRPPVPAALAGRVARLAAGPPPTLARWTTVRDAIGDLPEPIDYDPDPPAPDHVGIPDARSYAGHTGSPWDWPAKAIKAGDHGNPGGENMLRRDDGTVRYFTVRELARLQTFPDSWRFASSWTENRRQLGNAVPVRLAEAMATAVREELARVDARAAARASARPAAAEQLALVGDD